MVGPRSGLLLVLVIMLGALAQPCPSDAKSPPPVLDGADLPHAVTLAFADWQALAGGRPQPERVPAPPPRDGPVYRLRNWMWIDARAWAEEQQAEEAAWYHPAGGYLEVIGQTETAWFQVDPGRQTLLDRYLRLARRGRLPADPSVIEVLDGAAADETITVAVGWASREVPLPPAVAEAFWRATGTASRRSFSRPHPALTGIDVGFELRIRLPEGRMVTFWYDRVRHVFVDTIGIAQGWSELTGFAIDATVTDAVVDVATTTGIAFPEHSQAEAAPTSSPATTAVDGHGWRVPMDIWLGAAGILVVSVAVLRLIGRRIRPNHTHQGADTSRALARIQSKTGAEDST